MADGTGRARAVSGLEALLAAGVIVGHNVFRVIPNEVIILTVLGLASYRLRDGGWGAMGFRRPPSWTWILVIAAGAAALRIGLGEVVDPLAARIWPPQAVSTLLDAQPGDWVWALKTLALVWTFAAFGEEIAYRGYLMNRTAEAGAGSALAWGLAAVASAVLFGIGHAYKGPAGILDSGLAGLILAGAYLLAGRNLWAPILAHGFIDTTGVALVFLGLGD